MPKVNIVPPDNQYPSPNFAASIPEHLQVAVDGLLSQLERSVMLQVKSITSLKCVEPSHRGSRSWFFLENTTVRQAWRSSTLVGSTLPYWPSSQIGRPCVHPPSMKLLTLQRYIPADEPIDLLNVAFENPRKQAKNRKNKEKSTTKDHNERHEDIVSDPSTSYLVPDRETGLEGLAELRRLCPHRIWNFVCHDSRSPLLIED